MRRFMVCLVLAVLFISTAAQADTAYILCQPDSYVNARRFPKRGAEIAGRLELGERVETDWIKQNGFVLVYGFDGEAWVNMGFVTEYPVTVGTVKAQVESKGRVACRRSINGTRRKWLYNGAEVTVYALADDWAVTSQGFIQTRYLGGFYGK